MRDYKLSQHFLRSPKLALILIGHSNLKKRDLIVEIGAGSGVITSALSKRVNKVIAIEPNGMRAYISLKDPHIVVFYLDVCEKVRRERMLQRGDSPENVEQRIKEDKIRFGKDNVPEVDVLVDSQNYNQEEVTDYIYRKYQKILNERETK